MSRKTKKTGGGIAVTVLNVLIVVMVLILASNIVGLVRDVQDVDYSAFRQNRSSYSVEEERFGYMVQNYYEGHHDWKDDAGYDAEMLAVARYADGALRLRAFRDSNPEQAALAEARMQEAEPAMGIYANKAESIRRLAGLE